MVGAPGDRNYFLHAAMFVLLQLHDWNYELAPTHEATKAEVCLFLRGNRDMLDINGVSLDDIRMAWQDLRPVPPGGVVLEPPLQNFCKFWDQWVN